MLSCPESLGGVALLLTRAESFLHGRMHLRLQVAHARRNGTRRGQCKGCKASQAERSDPPQFFFVVPGAVRILEEARVAQRRVLFGGIQVPVEARGSVAAHRTFEPEIFAQRLALIFGTEQPTPLQLGHDQFHEVLAPARQM
jgi:hypothetical protein